MSKVLEYRKAIAGLIVPALVVLAAALQSGSEGGSSVTLSEWIAVAIAALGTGVGVAVIPNKPANTEQ